MAKKFMLFLWATLLLFSLALTSDLTSVSAWEFDDVLEYSPETKTATIFNCDLWIVTCLNKGEINAEIELLVPIHNLVGYGEEILVIEYRITTTQAWQDVFGDDETFKGTAQGDPIYKNIKYKYKDYNTEMVDNYVEVCNELQYPNGTYYNNCSYEIQGEIEQTTWEWKAFNKNTDLQAGVIDIGLFTEVEINGGRTEWIPNLFGKRLEFWSSWENALNVGLQGYYTFNESTGSNFADSLGGETLSLGDSHIAGIIGQGYKFDSSFQDSTNMNNTGIFTFNVWMRDVQNYYCFGNDADGTEAGDWRWVTTGGTAQFYTTDGAGEKFNTAFAINVSTWDMVTMVVNSTSQVAYKNGVHLQTVALSSFPSSTKTTRVGVFTNIPHNMYVDEMSQWERELSDSEISNLWNSGTGISWKPTGVDLGITAEFIAPIHTYKTTDTEIDLVVNFTASGQNITSVKVMVYDSLDNLDYTNTETGDFGVGYNKSWTTTTLTDDVYLWSGHGSGSLGINASTLTNRSFTIDTIDPVVNPATNLTNLNTLTMPVNSSFIYTVNDQNIGSCYFNHTENATYTIITCNDTTYNDILWETQGVKNIQYCANDTFEHETCRLDTISVVYITAQQSDIPDPAGEGGNVVYELRVNMTSIPTSSAYLIVNNTRYNPTTIQAYANYYLFSRSVYIPEGWGSTTGNNISFHWNYTIDGVLTNRSTNSENTTIYTVGIDDCTSYGYAILNLSLKDEELNSLVNLTSPNQANIEIDIVVTSLTDTSLTWEYSKQWANNDTVAVCVPSGLLDLSSYKIDFTIGYDATDKVREFFYMDNGTLDNSGYFNSYTSTDINLMDLTSADSTTFLFEYTDQDNQEVDDIIVHTFRNYIGEGTYREVERSRQDNSGQTHIHLVEEDVIYYFMITQYGNIIFTSDTYNAKCLSSPCEITLSASATEQNWSLIDNEGGKYQITTDRDTRIVTTLFNLEQIALVNASVYRFYNGNTEYINGSSLTATSGSIDLHVPLVYDNSTFFVAVYRDNVFIKSQWIDLTESGRDYFGRFGAILGGLIVLAMMLMAVTEGAGFIIFTILALIIVVVMQLVELSWLAIISVVCAGGIIVWKLISRRGSRQ